MILINLISFQLYFTDMHKYFCLVKTNRIEKRVKSATFLGVGDVAYVYIFVAFANWCFDVIIVALNTVNQRTGMMEIQVPSWHMT